MSLIFGISYLNCTWFEIPTNIVHIIITSAPSERLFAHVEKIWKQENDAKSNISSILSM